MPFKLNEAPQIVLSALNQYDVKRCCGGFWSILCFLPTFGMTSGYCDGNDCKCFDANSNNDWAGCCWPMPPSNKCRAGLVSLKQTLKMLMIKTPWSIVWLSDEQVDAERKKAIETQVANTINVLDEAIKDYLLEGGFMDVVKRCRETIYTRALAEENMGKRIVTDHSVLTGGNIVQIPDYGLSTKEGKAKKKPDNS